MNEIDLIQLSDARKHDELLKFNCLQLTINRLHDTIRLAIETNNTHQIRDLNPTDITLDEAKATYKMITGREWT